MDMMVATRPEQVGLSSERLARIAGWAQRLVDDGKLSGRGTPYLRAA